MSCAPLAAMVDFFMPILDRQNRAIDYLRVSVTDRCNLACTYCKPRTQMRELPHNEILRYEEIGRIVLRAVALGITRVRITGGEPLVRRGVTDFIASLRDVPGIEDVSITTNGVLLEEMADALRAAGVSRLNISLDSLRRSRFREITGSDAWDAVWRGIRRAEDLGFRPIKINVVPVKGLNDDEIADFARLTLDRALHVRFIEFMPIGSNDRWHRDECITTDRIRAVIESALGPLEPYTSERWAGPSDNYRVRRGQGIIGFISPLTKHFCAACRRLRLTPEGKIRPCLLSDTEIDIKSPMRGGCRDEEIDRLLRLALELKPERHYIGDGETQGCRRTMSSIGG